MVTVRSLAGPKTIFLGHITNVSCCLRINFEFSFFQRERERCGVTLDCPYENKTKQICSNFGYIAKRQYDKFL